jgi:hypothetical protein
MPEREAIIKRRMSHLRLQIGLSPEDWPHSIGHPRGPNIPHAREHARPAWADTQDTPSMKTHHHGGMPVAASQGPIQITEARLEMKHQGRAYPMPSPRKTPNCFSPSWEASGSMRLPNFRPCFAGLTCPSSRPPLDPLHLSARLLPPADRSRIFRTGNPAHSLPR